MSELDRESPARPEQVRLRLIVYPLLLRREPEVWAELRLPTDLTTAEAERVARYVRTLAIDAHRGGATANEAPPIDVATLRRLVNAMNEGERLMKSTPTSSPERGAAVRQWLDSRRELNGILIGRSGHVVAALEEREGLRQRVAALEIALRDTDARMWEWSNDTEPDADADWRPLSVREPRRVNGLLLGRPNGAAREAEEGNGG
jgi:hypothetical protein